MPTKTAHLIAFLIVFLISAGLHRFVFVNLKRVVQRDFPRRSATVLRVARAVFIVMDLPFLFLFFRNQIHAPLELLTKILLYPFSIWQAIMIMWAAILLPLMLWRRVTTGAMDRKHSPSFSKSNRTSLPPMTAAYSNSD